jgi:NitT/TauT family transport system substrate-binding protein
LSAPSRARLLAAAGAALLAARPAGAQTLEKIRIVGVPTDDMTPVFYAIRTGAYARAGLEVEVASAGGGTASTEAVLAGAYELGKGSPTASILAHLRGLPLKIVANGALWLARSPFSLILTAADSPIRTATDCNGKTGSASGLADIAQLAMMQWVDRNGGDSKTMKWIELPNSARGAAVAEHRIDITTINEPQLTAAMEGGKVRVLGDAFSAIAERWAAVVYFAQPEWATKHADALRRWIRVTYESAGYTNAHKNETAPLMAEVTKIPLPFFAKMTRTEGATATEPALMQPVIDIALRYKVIPRAFPARDMFMSV